jgi:hypothetical protein
MEEKDVLKSFQIKQWIKVFRNLTADEMKEICIITGCYSQSGQITPNGLVEWFNETGKFKGNSGDFAFIRQLLNHINKPRLIQSVPAYVLGVDVNNKRD